VHTNEVLIGADQKILAQTVDLHFQKHTLDVLGPKSEIFAAIQKKRKGLDLTKAKEVPECDVEKNRFFQMQEPPKKEGGKIPG
jgi:hypothetical protein